MGGLSQLLVVPLLDSSRGVCLAESGIRRIVPFRALCLNGQFTPPHFELAAPAKSARHARFVEYTLLNVGGLSSSHRPTVKPAASMVSQRRMPVAEQDSGGRETRSSLSFCAPVVC